MSLHPQSKKLNSLKIELNRLRTSQVVVQRKISKQAKSERRARTRTLIQLGGLVNMIGLTEMFGIVEGDDLQLDIPAQDKAATLLGMLVTLIEQLPPTLSDLQAQAFKQKGIRMFKHYEAKKYRSLALNKSLAKRIEEAELAVKKTVDRKQITVMEKKNS
jgi:hypothetical protein